MQLFYWYKETWFINSLLILCSISFVIFAFIHIYFTHSHKKRIPINLLNSSKTVIQSICALFVFIEVSRRYYSDKVENRLHFLSALVLFVAELFSVFLVQYDRLHKQHRSFLQFFFKLFCTSIASIYIYNAFSQSSISYLIALLFYLLLNIIILFLNACCNDQVKQDTPPQSKACIISHFIFWWFSGLVIRVGRGRDVEKEVWPLKQSLTSNDLTKLFQQACRGVASLRECMKVTNHKTDLIQENSSHNENEFHELQEDSIREKNIFHTSAFCAKSNKKPMNKDRKKGLVKVLVGCVWKYYLKAACINFISDASMFASPLLLKVMIESCRDASVHTSELMVVVVMLFVCSNIHTLLKNHCIFMYNIVSFRIHTILYNAIYRRLMKKGGEDLSKVVNLMTVDVQKVVDVVSMLNYLWSFPLQTGICLHLLWQLLGPSCLTGLGVMVAMLPINSWVAAKCKVFQANQLKYKDARVKMVHEVVSAIKVIKLYAWENIFLGRMQEARSSELRMLLRSAYLSAVATFAWASTPLLISASTFAVFTLTSSSPLTAEKAFVSLSLFNILRSPFSMLPILVTNLTVAKVSVKRLEEFFGIGEEEERRGKGGEYTEQDEDSGFGRLMLQDVIMRDVTVAWEGDPVLHNINLKVERGSLVGVMGGVSSGKSTLLSCLLGQAVFLGGSIKVKGTIAYTGQEAWLQNLSIRDNIIFGSQMDAERYEEVLHACCLQRDLHMLPGSDLTEVAEKGVNLSGGQKQRICMARSLYRSSDIYLFDDPFASLDNHVSKQIFRRVLSSQTGFLRNKTRIVVTNNQRHMEHFDRIIMLSNKGTIDFNGSYQSFRNHPSFIHPSTTHSFTNHPSFAHQNGRISMKKEVANKFSLEKLQNVKKDEDENKENSRNQSKSEDPLEQVQQTRSVQRLITHNKHQNHGVQRSSSLNNKPSCNTSTRSLSNPTCNTLPRNFNKPIQTDPLLTFLLRYESLPLTFNPLINPEFNASSYSLYGQQEIRKEEMISDDDDGDYNDENDGEKRILKDVVLSGGDEKKAKKLVEDEVLKTEKISSKVYLGYIKSMGGMMLLLALLSCVLNNILLVATNIWLSRWADESHRIQPSNHTTGSNSLLFSADDVSGFDDSQSDINITLLNLTFDQSNITNVEATEEKDAIYRLIIYIVLGLLFSATLLLRSMLVAMACAKASKEIFTRVMHSVIGSSFSFFQTTPTGRIVNRLAVDIATVDFTLPFTVSGFVNICLMATFSFCIIAYNLPLLLLPSIPLFLIHQVVQNYYRRTLRQLRRLEGIRRSLLITHVGETLRGLAVVRAWRQEGRFDGMFQQKVDQVQCVKYLCLAAVRWLSVWLELVGNLLVMGVGVMAVFIRWQLSAGLLGLVMTYSFDIVQSVNSLLSLHCELESGLVAVERLMEYAGLSPEGEEEKEHQAPAAGWPREGRVEVRSFTGGYDSTDVLFNVNLCISAGEKLGVVGRTGSGKSSLLMTLLRGLNSRKGNKFHDGMEMVDSLKMGDDRLVGEISNDILMERKCEKLNEVFERGVVEVDGVDVSKVPLHLLRSCITIIPQDPVLFSGSLRFNIDPTQHHSDEQLWSVLRDVCMQSTVLSLPGGLDHEMQPDDLSVGQKQLLCLARAVLRKSRVLLLDEATASVDPATQHTILSLLNLTHQDTWERKYDEARSSMEEESLGARVDGGMTKVMIDDVNGSKREDLYRSESREKGGIEKYLRSCTMVVVAHRLTNVLNCHRVVVMEGGRIVEIGHPQSMLADQQSIFYKMYHNILPNN